MKAGGGGGLEEKRKRLSCQAELVEPSGKFMGLSISVCFSPLTLFALISLLLDQNTETQSSSRQSGFFFFIIYRDTGSPWTQEERIPRLRGVSFVDAINLHACTFYRFFNNYYNIEQ